MTQEEYVEAVAQRTDTYVRTIEAVICLKSALCYDDQAGTYPDECRFASGRRMTPSTGTDASPGADLTPDVVVQLNPQSGLVGEIKLTASSDRDFENAEQQIRKYDDDLTGWWTRSGTIESHRLFCLVSHVHVGAAQRHFDACGPFERQFLLLDMARDDTLHSFICFELRRGTFPVDWLNSKFDPTLTVPLEILAPDIGPAKFCDAKPPCVEWTMTVLWDHYFAERESLETRHVTRQEKEIEQRKIVVPAARDFLREGYSISGTVAGDERQPGVPKAAWIREAMEHFVAIKRAGRDEDNNDVYWVSYSSEARATSLRDFARQVFKGCPPQWAAVEAEPQRRLPHTTEEPHEEAPEDGPTD